MALDYGVNTLATISGSVDIFLGTHPVMEMSKIEIAAGQKLVRGACIAKKDTDVVASTAVDTVTGSVVTGTGNGTLALEDPSYATGVKAGVYRVTCIEPGTDAGTFEVEDPDGIVIGRAIAASSPSAFDGVVKFKITIGETDFAAGDFFTITVVKEDTVTAHDDKYYLWDTTKLDGRQNLLGILGCDVDATNGAEIGFIYTHGEFNKAALTAVQTVNTGIYNNGTILIKEEVD